MAESIETADTPDITLPVGIAAEESDKVVDLEANGALKRTKSKVSEKREARRSSNGDNTPQRRQSTAIFTCEKCKLEIIPKKGNKKLTSEEGNMHWHEECFKCEHCAKSLYINGFFLHEGELYCDKCMDELFGHVCVKCGEPIRLYTKDEEEISSADGKEHWHEKCIRHIRQFLRH